jgi:hypothetical protein
MSRDLFQIERSRRIQISIPGYDPVFETQKIDKRFKRLRDKKKRQHELAAQKQKEAMHAQLKTQEVALEELSNGNAQARAAPVQSSQVEAEENLFV